MGELWKPVYGYEDFYEVSSEGRVRSKDRYITFRGKPKFVKGRVLKPQTRSHGYLSIWLYNGEDRWQVSVHRLVATAFCKREDGQNEVNHLNEDKQDNRAVNLEWCTKSENCSYGSRPSSISRKNTNGKKSKAVVQNTMDGEFVYLYPSLHEVTRQTNFGFRYIQRSATEGISAYGYRWTYA